MGSIWIVGHDGGVLSLVKPGCYAPIALQITPSLFIVGRNIIAPGIPEGMDVCLHSFGSVHFGTRLT